MPDSKKPEAENKDPKPSEVLTEPAPEPEGPSPEDRMLDYMISGEVDGEVYDGDPADIDWF